MTYHAENLALAAAVLALVAGYLALDWRYRRTGRMPTALVSLWYAAAFLTLAAGWLLAAGRNLRWWP